MHPGLSFPIILFSAAALYLLLHENWAASMSLTMKMFHGKGRKFTNFFLKSCFGAASHRHRFALHQLFQKVSSFLYLSPAWRNQQSWYSERQNWCFLGSKFKFTPPPLTVCKCLDAQCWGSTVGALAPAQICICAEKTRHKLGGTVSTAACAWHPLNKTLIFVTNQ